MKTDRKLSRRSFMATVAGGATIGTLGFAGPAKAQGCSDSDPISRGGDPGGRGRRCAGRPYTGCSDSDSGSAGDPGMRGRNCGGRPQGCSDTDPISRGGDPARQGRRCGGQIVRTQTACSQCSCPEYVATPGNRYAACARAGCGHAPNYHYGD